MQASFQFRCVGVAQRLVGSGGSEWEITFAPIVRPDGSENLNGHYGAFSVLVYREHDAQAFRVGDTYDFEVRTASERRVWPE